MSGAEPSTSQRVEAGAGLVNPIQISGFTLHRVIGVGAMGVVYEGVQRSPERPVAVKVLRLTTDNSHADRIRQEAAAVSRCNHPSIVKVHASGVLRGAGVELPWIAMERVEGARAIDAWFRECRPDRDAAVGIFERIADALQHAHLQGLLHRDLKPGNILVDGTGRPVVIDFGLVAIDGEDRRTEPGTLIGTMRTMAPEVIAGRRSDIRSDIFSLAVCMHECMTGDWPFGAPPDNLAAMARVIDSGAAAYASRHGRAIEGDLRWVLAKAISPEPADRHQSMLSFADDLRAVRASRPVLARRPSRPYRVRCWIKRNPLPAALAAALSLAVIVGLGVSIPLGIEAARELERANAYLSIWMEFMARQPVDHWPAGVTLRESVDSLARRHAFELDKVRPDRAQMIRALALSRAYLELDDAVRAFEMIHDAHEIAETIGASPGDRFELDLMELMLRASQGSEHGTTEAWADALHARISDLPPWRRSDAESIIMAHSSASIAWRCMQSAVQSGEPDRALMVAFALPHLAEFPEIPSDRLRWASEAAASLLRRVRGPSADLVKTCLRRGIDGLVSKGRAEVAEPLRSALVEIETNDG